MALLTSYESALVCQRKTLVRIKTRGWFVPGERRDSGALGALCVLYPSMLFVNFHPAPGLFFLAWGCLTSVLALCALNRDYCF